MGVNPSFEPNQDFSTAASNAAPGALLHPFAAPDPELARVLPTQQLLFPSSPRTVCEEMGLNWWAALKLHQEGWLSFSPENTPRLDEAQETELRFIGSLVVAGCDSTMLGTLLNSLAKPYAYDHKRLYYDWAARQWRVLPDPEDCPEGMFTDWLGALVHKKDISTLTGIDELARDALSQVQLQEAQPELQDSWKVTSDGETVQG